MPFGLDGSSFALRDDALRSGSVKRAWVAVFNLRSQLKREDPLNLSILVRGGKETNKDSPSNGE